MSLFGYTFDKEGKARIAAYEAELAANASDEDWLSEAEEESKKEDIMVKITVRASGKCHPAWLDTRNNWVMVACHCPNSQNGRLAATSKKVADGWDKVTCCS